MGGSSQVSNSSDPQFANYGYGWRSRDLQGYYKEEPVEFRRINHENE